MSKDKDKHKEREWVSTDIRGQMILLGTGTSVGVPRPLASTMHSTFLPSISRIRTRTFEPCAAAEVTALNLVSLRAAQALSAGTRSRTPRAQSSAGLPARFATGATRAS